MSPNEILEFEFESRVVSYTLAEVCEICQVTVDHIYELIDYGVLDPVGTSSAEWRFSTRSIVQARRAVRLQRDLELNLAGIALSPDLLDENARLRRELQIARAHLARFMPLPIE